MTAHAGKGADDYFKICWIFDIDILTYIAFNIELLHLLQKAYSIFILGIISLIIILIKLFYNMSFKSIGNFKMPKLTIRVIC